eukprot:TRINITY_DN5395_c1_g1_i1.p1 TRINITY_DN5395_c1_g1~~TRINITY_DN5395_c1_g1_i1.p1  ORF type:complete len:861 (+),score=245.95 TRINITY_DN5395_c1_g1_i1:95-2677(+)
METTLSSYLRIREWPLVYSVPVVVGAGVCMARGVVRNMRDANEWRQRQAALESPLCVHEMDVSSLYTMWCAGERSIEHTLWEKIQRELHDGAKARDSVRVTHLLACAQHLSIADRSVFTKYEACLSQWKAERYRNMMQLIKYAQPRIDVVTVVAMLNAVRPFLWERAKRSEETLACSAKSADLPLFVTCSARYVFYALIDGAIGWGISYLRRQELASFTNKVKVKIIKHLLSLDLAYFDTHKVDLSEFHEDVDKLRYLVTDRLFQVIRLGLMSVHTVRLAMESKGQCLVSVGCLVALPALVKIRNVVMQLQDKIDGVSGTPLARRAVQRQPSSTVQALLGRLQVVRCTVAEEEELNSIMGAEMAHLNDAVTTQSIGERSLESLRGTILPNLILLYLACVGFKAVDFGMLAVENVPTTVEVTIEAFDQLHAFYDEATEITDCDYAIRLMQLLNTSPSIDTGAGRVLPEAEETGAIVFDNVSFQYSSTNDTVLKGASFSVPYGTRLAIIGRSGTGKSTLAALLIRLYEATTGVIRYSDVDIRELDCRWLRRRVSVIQQVTQLPPGTILDALRYGVEYATRADIERVAKQVKLHDAIMRLKDGYATKLGGNHAPVLSGGQIQRIAIARALLSKPKVLVLDEATNGLDRVTERDIMTNLTEMLQEINATLIMITHRTSALEYCNKVICVRNGVVHDVDTSRKGGMSDGFSTQCYGSIENLTQASNVDCEETADLLDEPQLSPTPWGTQRPQYATVPLVDAHRLSTAHRCAPPATLILPSPASGDELYSRGLQSHSSVHSHPCGSPRSVVSPSAGPVVRMRDFFQGSSSLLSPMAGASAPVTAQELPAQRGRFFGAECCETPTAF